VNRLTAALLVFAFRGAGSGQTLLDPDAVSKVRPMFDQPVSERGIACEVTQLKPHLNFSLRLQAGYIASWPLKGYPGKGHWFVVLTRVTTAQSTGEPVFFSQSFKLPNIPSRSKEKLQVDGAYFLGKGHYTVDLMVLDKDGRHCQKTWRIEAKLPGKAEQIKVAQAPGSVLPVTFERWKGILPRPAEDGATPRRLTILLHVTPLYARSNRLHAYDRVLLLSSLLSLLNQTSFSQIKLVAFNLDQQKELVHENHFDASGWDKLVRATGQLELGTVSYEVLQHRTGHADLLTRLVDEELKAEEPPEVVLFLGPAARQEEKLRLPKTESEAARPLFLYFEYRPFWSRGGEFPDIIDHLTRSQSGKVFRIHSPQEFADAIQRMEKLAEERRS
jgi:hypothetical protein